MNFRNLAASLALVSLFAGRSLAQCLVPDNLDAVGAACQGTQTQVPQRAFAQGAVGICWRDCGIDSTANYIAQWAALTPITAGSSAVPPQASCGWYKARVKISNGSGLQWSGQMTCTYARTWLESPMPGQVMQVWRYLCNGDMQAITSAAMPCGTPACAPTFNNLVRFTGYVDYAYDCGTGITRRAWMLTHACDAIDHVAGYPRAGSFHPNRYYTFVGPGASFTPALGATLEAGAVSQEDIRKWDAPVLPARCNYEEPLLGGTISAMSMNCMCGTGPSNWYEGQLFVGGAFGSTVSSFAAGSPFRSFPVGSWTNPAIYPGVEELRWNCGEYIYIDCTGVGRQEFYYGVTTAGGFSPYSFNASTPPAPLPTTFIDQANSAILPGAIGTRNRPFRSDRVLNLNM